MFQINSLILCIFLFILEVLFELILNKIYKVFKVFEIFSKKNLEIRPWYWVIIFIAKLLLLSPKIDLFTHKNHPIEVFVVIFGTNNINIVLISLVKKITFHVKYVIKKIRESIFKDCF